MTDHEYAIAERMYRRVNLAKIDAVRGELDISFTEPRARLKESLAFRVDAAHSGLAVIVLGFLNTR